jgi:hypothetical protein
MFTGAMQLKDWIKNKSKQTGAPPNALLQNHMMERFLYHFTLLMQITYGTLLTGGHNHGQAKIGIHRGIGGEGTGRPGRV